MFGQKGGLQQNVFLWTCALQNVKSYRFLGAIFWQILVDGQKTISDHFKAQKQKWPFFKVINLARSKWLTGPSLGSKKKANLAQLITLKICARKFFNKEYVLEPLFLSCSWQTV